MNRKLCVGLLILTFILGSGGGFWSKPAQANTGPKISLCAAEPWDNDFCQSSNPSPPDTSALSNTGNRDSMQNAQQSSASNKTDSRVSNFFHRILRALWGVIFPESF